MAIFAKNDPRLAVFDHFIVHAAATTRRMKNVDAAWIDREHRKRGWSGCGYHAVITRSGKLQMRDRGDPTRPLDKVGAHVGGCGPGWNRRSFGVCLAGGLDEDGRPENNFTKRQFRALKRLIVAFLSEHAAPETVRIMGHRDLIRLTRASPKACPCFDVADFMQEYGLSEDEDAGTGDLLTALTLPAEYRVRRGDSLWKIAQTYGVSVAELMAWNDLKSDVIKPGQTLRLFG